jgi:hypothetical protein
VQTDNAQALCSKDESYIAEVNNGVLIEACPFVRSQRELGLLASFYATRAKVACAQGLTLRLPKLKADSRLAAFDW